MFKKIIRALALPPVAEEKITSKVAISKMYHHWRWRMFVGSYIGYVVFYLMRKNISTSLPAMSRELGYSNTELGILGSTLYITYGIGKFVNGVIGDRANMRYFSVIGLVGSVICSVLFGMTSSLFWLAFFWGLNGWFQSMGIAPYMRALANWFNIGERGKIVGFWTTSHQTGTLLIFWITSFLLVHYSWRTCFYVPAVIGIITAAALVIVMRDRPEAMGLPPIEQYKREEIVDAAEEAREEDEYEHSFWRAFVHKILLNKWVWLCAFINVFVYVVRFGADDWAPKFMVEVKGNTDAMAAFKSSANPLVGILGMIFAGYISDKYFSARRGPIACVFMFLLAVSIIVFYKIPQGHPVWDFIALGVIGFFTYGPQLLIATVAPIDFGSKRLAASANGLIGTFGYLGATISGIGTGIFVDRWGWGGGAAFWTLCALAGGILTIFMWKAKPKTA
jgi:sugar phosphate permease